MTVGKGELLEGRVRDLTHGGDAVIETARGLVLARGALPDERVRVRLERRKGGVQRGTLIELLAATDDRVPAPCPEMERCGGCPLMTLAQPAQARWKREHLRALLSQRGAELEPEWFESPQPFAYRARARIAFRARSGTDAAVAQLGYHAAASRALIDVARCAVLSEPLAAGYARLRELLAPELSGEGEIALGLGAEQRCAVELRSSTPQSPALYAAAERLAACLEIAGVAVRIGEARSSAAATWGDPRQLAEGADGLPLWAPPGSFMQANPEVNAALVRRVAALAEPAGARVLELYAGHGNITIALAREAADLRAIESDRAAADACRENLRARGLERARVTCEDAARGAAGKGRVDVVVLDPPRTGAKEALPVILARAPARIVYVACDLASLRRDLGELVSAGYAVDAAAGFDMFPQTTHLESLVRLARRAR
jgi:23S rRNA (uracil1939-C5)-methyltransferase